MDEKTLQAIEERAKAATPGPWEVRPAEWSKDSRCGGIVAADDTDIVITDSGTYPPEMPDALFIAHARLDIPALVAEVRRLQGKHERLRQGLLGMREMGTDGVMDRTAWGAEDFRKEWLLRRQEELAAFIRANAEKIAALAEFTTEEDANEVRMRWRLAVGPPVRVKPEQPVVFAIRREP
jgi:hypothetical protein